MTIADNCYDYTDFCAPTVRGIINAIDTLVTSLKESVEPAFNPKRFMLEFQQLATEDGWEVELKKEHKFVAGHTMTHYSFFTVNGTLFVCDLQPSSAEGKVHGELLKKRTDGEADNYNPAAYWGPLNDFAGFQTPAALVHSVEWSMPAEAP